VVPGMGTIYAFCACNQAIAICAGVAFLRSAVAASKSMIGRLALRASGVKRGMRLRRSSLANEVFCVMVPVRKPLPSGLYGTKLIPSSSSDAVDTQSLQRSSTALFDVFRVAIHAG
jgi:hypothetical protein